MAYQEHLELLDRRLYHDEWRNQRVPSHVVLMGFLGIAVVDSDRAAEMNTLITGVPYTIPGVTCRTWVLEAIRRLIAARIVQCHDINDLESKAKAFAFSQFDSTMKNEQLRPIVGYINLTGKLPAPAPILLRHQLECELFYKMHTVESMMGRG